MEANWHAIKAQEKGRSSVTEGIPAALPSLVHIGKVLSRSATLPLPPLPQESVAAAALESIASEEDFGDLLVSLVALARERGIDAEAAGRGASRRLVERIRAVEAQ